MKIKKYWKFIIIFTVFIALINILARIRPVCDFYADNIFFLWSSTYGFIMGLFPFSVGSLMIAIGIIILVVAIVLSILLIFLRKRIKYKKFTSVYLKTLLVIALSVGLLYSLNCSALYRCTMLSKDCSEYNVYEIIDCYNEVATKCNELSTKVTRNAEGEAIYQGNLDKAIRNAIKKFASANKRFKGYVPRVKNFMYEAIYYQIGIIGMYYPFSMEANTSRHLTDLTKAYTASHELCHLKGYIYEDEANFMAFRICIESDDEFLQYAGYLGVLAYLNSDMMSTIWNTDKSLYSAEYLVAINYDVLDDLDTYKSEGVKKLEESNTVIPEEVIEEVTETITDAVEEYYQYEANYEEVTKLILKYYDGKLY